jgi:O-glycosyl hydrolase
VYAQFSRWITPGMTRHDVTGVPSNAQVLVYHGNGRTVVVGISPKGATGPTTFNLALPWLGRTTASVTRTSVRRNDSGARDVAVTNGVLPVTLPRVSVTTYVIPG